SMSYADEGRTVHRSWSAPTSSGGRSETTHLTAWGDPLDVETTDTGATILLGTWSYDAFRRPLQTVDVAGLTTSQTYDAFDRPLVATQPEPRGVVFNNSYTNDGLLSRVIAIPPVGPDQIHVRQFDYDGLGRMVQATDWGESYGSTADDVTTHMTWDSLGDKTRE